MRRKRSTALRRLRGARLSPMAAFVEILEARELLSALSPVQMRAAYGVNLISFNSVPGTGAGQTIAIVDAYHDPSIVADANTFSQTYGLQQFNVSGGPTLQVLNGTGGTTLPTGTNSTWSLEESLDVEWAHVIAPQANIIVFEANSSIASELFTAVQTAAATPGVSVVSLSDYSAESIFESSNDAYFTTPSGHPGVTFLACTGDNGEPGGYPAFSPNVIAVGGTTLSVDNNGDYLGESAWSGSGGGISKFESQPAYQNGKVNGTSSSYRTAPDVSMDAGTDVPIYCSSQGGWSDVGGTSLATPMWGGLIAIADQGLALEGQPSLDGPTQTLPLLYNLPSSDFHDITTGSNGFSATTGYDLATGLGSPIANLLVPDIVARYPAVSAPSPVSVNSNSSLSFSSVGGNAISVTDGFAGSNLEQLGLSVADGALTLAPGSGVTVTSGANDTASLTVQGTLAQLNAALNGLMYAPQAGYTGTDTLTISFADHIGGGNLTASSNVAVTVDTSTNQAPAFTSVNNAAFSLGSAGSFTVTASGSPAPTLSESGTLPTGITFNSSTGVLSGTPASGTSGTYNLTFTATNGVGSPATQSFTLTVNQPPAITSANNAAFTVGSAGNLTVTVSGFPAPTLSESGVLPTGVTFNASTGVLSGTPAAGTGGTYNLTFTASNGVGTAATQSFTLTVNQPPAITSANNTAFTVGSAGSFTVTASGFPAPTFSESGALPTGITFNASTGVLSGTPAAATSGTYNVTFTASNGVGTAATQSFTLTVNQPPAITSANNAAFTVGSAGSLTVTASGSPAPTLSESGTLPAGVTFNAATGVLSGTPAAGTGGTYNLTFTAANGVGSPATQSFTLTVNQPPAITSANNTAFTVGSATSFAVTVSGFPAPTLSESGVLPTGVTFNASTGVLSGTPAAGTGGTYNLTFTAANGVGSPATQSFTLTVNQPPAITSANNTAFTVGSDGSFTMTASGFPTPTFSELGALPTGITFNASTGVLSGTPAAATSGTYNVTFTASNGVGAAATQSFTLTVNQPTAITSANNTAFTVGSAGSFAMTASGFPTPTLSESGTLPTGVTFNTSTGVLSGTPAAGTGGTYNLTFTAANGVGSAATQSFTLTVNQPPAVTSAYNTAFTVGGAGSFTVTASGFPASTLSESGTLPTGVTFNTSTGVLSGTPAAGTGGVYILTFTASNGVGTAATQNFTLTINQAPAITSADNATSSVGNAGSFTVTASGSPAPALSESGALPTGVSFNPSTGALSGTPAGGTSGTYNLTFSASNGVGSPAIQSFTLQVNPAPASKLVFLQAPATGTAGQALSSALKFGIEDQFGNLVTNGNLLVTLTLNHGVLAGGGTTLAVESVNGVATFSNLVIDTAGSQTFNASSGSLSGATSSSITISPSKASQLAFRQTPATGTAGQALSPSVQVAVEDQFGNVITNNKSTITLAVHSGPGAFATGSTTSVTAVNGVASFSKLVLNLAGSYTLSAHDGSLVNGISDSITINSAPTSKLVFQQMPTTGIAGQALNPSVKVALEDQFGNLVTSANSMITLALNSGSFGGGGTTATTQAVNGVATFSNPAINTAGNHILSASDGDHHAANSHSITVKPAQATNLVFLQIPTTGTAGKTLSPSVKVAVEDQFGNVITNNKTTVTLTVHTGPGGFAPGSSLSVSTVNGVATFSQLLLKSAGTYTLAASDGPLISVTPGSLTVNAAKASRVVILQTPAMGIVGQALGPSVQVAVEDAYGNVVTAYQSAVTVAVHTGPGGFAKGSTVSVAAANGLATFDNLVLSLAGNYTLVVESGSLTRGISNTIVI